MNLIGLFRTSLAHSSVFGRYLKHCDLRFQRSVEEGGEGGGEGEIAFYKSPRALLGGGDLKIIVSQMSKNVFEFRVHTNR